MPGRLTLAVAACLVTVLVVAAGVALTPGTPHRERALVARAAALTATEERRPMVTARAVVLETLAPFRTARPVRLHAQPRKSGHKKSRKPALPPAAEFVISSFNVLGSSHTRGRGGMAPGVVRIRQVVNLLNHHGVDVVGMQELQSDQYRELLRVAGGTFAVYPGLSAGSSGVDNSLAWRRSEWELVEARVIAIPYFDGRRRPMPYVLLRHVGTGRLAWFGNFHNPASNSKRGNNDRWRAAAAATEVSLANRLWSDTGYPVFITGDMNDREPIFCRMTVGAPMQAANGDSPMGGPCTPPRSPMPVDWIFGSDAIDFSGYFIDDSSYVRRTSDHRMIISRATLDLTDGVPQPD